MHNNILSLRIVVIELLVYTDLEEYSNMYNKWYALIFSIVIAIAIIVSGYLIAAALSQGFEMLNSTINYIGETFLPALD